MVGADFGRGRDCLDGTGASTRVPEESRRITHTGYPAQESDIEALTDSIEGDRIQWRGGDHTQLRVSKNRTGEHRWSKDAATGNLIRELAWQLPYSGIAVLLNRLGRRTGQGNARTRGRVQPYRAGHGARVYRKGERREPTLVEAAERLSASPVLVRRLIRTRIVATGQICKGVPWMIAGKALEAPRVVTALAGAADPKQRELRFGTR